MNDSLQSYVNRCSCTLHDTDCMDESAGSQVLVETCGHAQKAYFSCVALMHLLFLRQCIYDRLYAVVKIMRAGP